jgi:hypothetical protein
VPEEQLDALAHLLRGLVREGDREDLAGARAPGVDEVGDAVGEHPRLPGAGAREDQQRAVAVGDRLALRRVQAFQ